MQSSYLGSNGIIYRKRVIGKDLYFDYFTPIMNPPFNFVMVGCMTLKILSKICMVNGSKNGRLMSTHFDIALRNRNIK